MDNILSLHLDLKNKTYRHGDYQAFNISDPKPRRIHKASVRDRLLHHAVYRVLYPYFDKKFIHDSYSCRLNKGTHKALNRFKYFAGKVSHNNTKQCWVLKCDIKRFFATIDHNSLRYIVTNFINDNDINWLLSQIIKSFHTLPDKGLPLGNLTSQLLVNIYMNEFDHFVKHKIKARYYIRYADDFVIFSEDKGKLGEILFSIRNFLNTKLKLELHPNKVSISTLSSGIDFLGWVHFPNHRVLRTATKKRMIKTIKMRAGASKTIQSYFGLLKHGNSWKLRKRIKENWKN